MPERKEKPKEPLNPPAADEDSAEASAGEAPSYYYDDAHGYEDFDPETDEEASE